METKDAIENLKKIYVKSTKTMNGRLVGGYIDHEKIENKSIDKAIAALELQEQNEVLSDTVNMLSPLIMENYKLKKENKEMKTYIRNGIELGYIDDRESCYKKYI